MSTGGKQIVLLTKTAFSLSIICPSQRDTGFAVLLLKPIHGHTWFQKVPSEVILFHLWLDLLALRCRMGRAERRFSVLLVKKDTNKEEPFQKTEDFGNHGNEFSCGGNPTTQQHRCKQTQGVQPNIWNGVTSWKENLLFVGLDSKIRTQGVDEQGRLEFNSTKKGLLINFLLV